MSLSFAVSACLLALLASHTPAAATSREQMNYENLLSRQLGLDAGQSVLKVSSADTLYGTKVWRLRPTCAGVPFLDLDFAAEFTEGSFSGRSSAVNLPSCEDPALLAQLACPALEDNADFLGDLEGYKRCYLHQVLQDNLPCESSLPPLHDIHHYQTIRRRLLLSNDTSGGCQVVDEVDAVWEGPGMVARAYIRMNACNGSLVDIFNRLSLLGSRSQDSETPPFTNQRRRRSPHASSSSSSDCHPPCPRGEAGNDLVGVVQLGPEANQTCLDVTVDDGQFVLQNQFAAVHDFRYLHSSYAFGEESVVSFDCASGPNDAVDSSRSPAYDALKAMGIITDLMFTWYPDEAEELLAERVHVGVHFGTNFSNSGWTGRGIIAGDGEETRSLPFTTLDTLAHEFGHLINERYANLLPVDQAGGLHDSFSDAFAKAADAFSNDGENVRTWELGRGIILAENSRSAIRYMDDPPLDHRSIDHADQMDDELDSHYSCGVFNKFFYCLAEWESVSIREAFLTYLIANKIRWNSASLFEAAACDVLRTAYDVGVNTDAVRACFNDVGLLEQARDCTLHVRTLCHGGSVTVQASKTRHPYFQVCQKSSHSSLRLSLASPATLLVSRGSPYSAATHDVTRGQCEDDAGALLYSEALDGNVYVRIVGARDELETVRFSVSFSSDEDDDNDFDESHDSSDGSSD